MHQHTHYLKYCPPLAWSAMLRFYSARAVPGVETVSADAYRRLLGFGVHAVAIDVRHDETAAALAVTLDDATPNVVTECLTQVGFAFDLATDVAPIERHLRRDALLASCIAACPGLRPPGAWSGFELAVRAVLGQQITVTAARGLAARLVALCGQQVAPREPGLTHLFPTATEVATADLSALGMPQTRRLTLQAMAHAVRSDPELLRPTQDLDLAVARWRKIPGIGAWTAHYIALRALRACDAFPASDIGLVRAAATGGVRPTPALLSARAEAWRPWRAYAAQHLWSAVVSPP